MSRPSAQDERWMRRALELASRGEGLTRPNPPVGAVILKGGALAGEGWHRKAGGPHAEIHALALAGGRARDGTLFVTLEPCCTWGRTPPCTDAILAAGIREVVVCARDPNPAHAGRGITLLRRRGVQVRVGVCAEEGARLIAPFAKWITTRRPYLTLKLGVSLDGRIADRTGSSRWITGPQARREVQALRRRCDAILVGGETVRADDPLLTPRPARGRKPWRVVVASRGGIPLTSRILHDEQGGRALIAVSELCPARQRRALESTGANVAVLPAEKGRIDVEGLLTHLGGMGLLHVLCEGGGRLAASLVERQAVDEFLFFIAPCLLGGEARAALGGTGWLLGEMPRLKFTRVERAGNDVMIRAVPLRKRRR